MHTLTHELLVKWKWQLYLGKIIRTFRKSTAAVSAKYFFFSFLLALSQALDDNCIECWLLLLLLRRWKFPILLPQSLMGNMRFIAVFASHDKTMITKIVKILYWFVWGKMVMTSILVTLVLGYWNIRALLAV